LFIGVAFVDFIIFANSLEVVVKLCVFVLGDNRLPVILNKSLSACEVKFIF